MTDSQKKAAAHFAALLTILIWGTTFISTKVLLVEFTPLEILFFRFILGYIVLWAVYPRFFKMGRIREELLFAGAGLCGVTMYFLLENIALVHTLASNVGIIVSLAPFITAVLAHFLLKEEPLHLQFFIGFIVAILGIVFITLNGSYILKLNPLGDVLAILACLFWGAYSILMRHISKLGYPAVGSTRRVFFYGLIFMLPVLPVFDFRLDLERFAEGSHLLNLLFLGMGASALCFVTWNWSVGVLGAVKTSIYIYPVPVITVAASYLILHENITGTALLGTFLTLAGLFLSEKKAKKAKKNT
ncbi:DMT family transporter [Paenibacillus oleatilyticus]|uniref:DMT family transporter n=1 Tax=Paenibacillus oleatilyticus TaxID=2594886 RepID=UPI001C1F2AF9|nr:DMT family transporter [Paenibacillus oleatilyticus]MBU7318562.1 DMT family transporter [Paenibacillus oleatilyticus]